MEVIKGRMYDYNNGRFLSVDPFIQSPTSTQSMNPYTYIFNNPLSGTDPSGYATCKEDDTVDCLEDGENEIVDDDGNAVRTIIVTNNGNVNGGVNLNNAIQAIDKAISDLKSVVNEQRENSGSIKYNGGIANSVESKALGELQSYRKILGVYKYLTDRFCSSGGCSGSISPVLIEHFVKLTQSFGINVAMGPLGYSGRTSSIVNLRPLSFRSGLNNSILSFSAEEIAIINEARNIVNSDKFSLLVQAGELNRALSVKINGRLIQFEPDLNAAGFTLFGEDAFLIGREALISSNELKRTVLQELHRLKTSKSADGLSGPMAGSETRSAQSFSDRAFEEL